MDGGVNLAPLVIDEVRVQGSRCGPIERALAWLGDPKRGGLGAFDVRTLISEEVPLSDVARGFERARTKGTIKVVVDCCR